MTPGFQVHTSRVDLTIPHGMLNIPGMRIGVPAVLAERQQPPPEEHEGMCIRSACTGGM